MVRAAPPTSWLASTKQTDQPASASRNAATNPVGPTPGHHRIEVAHGISVPGRRRHKR
jgi:hypothetical protein